MLQEVKFMKINCAESAVWAILGILRVHPGTNYVMYWEPRELITQTVVRWEHLIYHSRPTSDPICHEKLWGPETYWKLSNMNILGIFPKITDTLHSTYATQCKLGLREGESSMSGFLVLSGALARVTVSLRYRWNLLPPPMKFWDHSPLERKNSRRSFIL